MFGIQQHVAARERQPVIVAYGGAGDDVDGQVQVLAEASDDHLLLEVLLAEVGRVGCGDIEHLDDDGGHSFEMVRSVLSFEDLAESSDVDGGLSVGWVDGVFVGREDEVDVECAAGCQVVLESSGVELEVVGVVELWGIDEQRDHDESTIGHGLLDQAGVSVVQCAHGRHAADTQLVASCRTDQLANLVDTPSRPHSFSPNLVSQCPCP